MSENIEKLENLGNKTFQLLKLKDKQIEKLALELAALKKCPANTSPDFCEKCNRKSITKMISCWRAWSSQEG